MNFKSLIDSILESGKRKSGDDKKGEPTVNSLPQEFTNWINIFANSELMPPHVVPCTYILDYGKFENIHFSPSVLYLTGVHHSAFLGTNGPLAFMDLVNPNDFKVYNDQIFPKQMELLSSLPVEETGQMIFSNNFRITHSSGFHKTLLVKKTYIIDPLTRLPLCEFGILIDISSFKKELSITHTIERFHLENNSAFFMKVVTEDYFPEMHANILSAREKEILINLAIGTKRKDVGAKLFISDNTVANHIKAILRKTNSKNIREAIALCKMNGII